MCSLSLPVISSAFSGFLQFTDLPTLDFIILFWYPRLLFTYAHLRKNANTVTLKTKINAPINSPSLVSIILMPLTMHHSTTAIQAHQTDHLHSPAHHLSFNPTTCFPELPAAVLRSACNESTGTVNCHAGSYNLWLYYYF